MAPKLSQEEFDEAVRTNIEDFEMEAEEAVASAIEEFKLQGYNLDGIIKSSTGGQTDSHPIAVATRALLDAASSAAAAGPEQLSSLQQRTVELQQEFKGLSSSDLQQALAVANKEGTVAALLASAKAALQLSSNTSHAAASETSEIAPHDVMLLCLRCLRLLMQLPDCRASFLAEGGPELLLQLLRGCCSALDKLKLQQQQQQQQQGDAGGPDAADVDEQLQVQQYQLAAAVAALAEAAAWQDEEAKCRFMSDGFALQLLELLQLTGSTKAILHSTPTVASAAATAAGAAAGGLRAFTTADDDRPPASKAFMHARLLAGKPNNALQVLLPVFQQLQQCSERPVGPLVAVLGAIRQVSANDEICKAFSEAGGVSALQQLLAAAAEEGPPELVRAAAAALRQLANSDGIKAQLAEAGVLAPLLRAVRVYSTSQPAVQEQLLGLLVAMVLRMPDIAAAAAEAGAADVLTEVLAAAPAMAAEAKANGKTAAANGSSKASSTAAAADAASPGDQNKSADADDIASKVFGVGGSNGSSGGGSGSAVQRQACMAVRNVVVRNPELRPSFLAAGAEQLLRSVKVLFPGPCKDVASAALRDLGLDNYQD